MPNIIVGIDPGAKGGIAALSLSKEVLFLDKFTDCTEVEIRNVFLHLWRFVRSKQAEPFCYIEKVHSRPFTDPKTGKLKQSPKSLWAFAQNYGFLRGMLVAYNTPFMEIEPIVWQAATSCLTGGDKKISRNKAQNLYPATNCTHYTADALLIATYGVERFLRDRKLNKE
jgi:hypothetical protein